MVNNDPYWWEEIDRESFTGVDFADEYDAVVIGGGLTGTSAARTLAKNGQSVLLLEAEKICFGASTRNGGMIGEGHRVPLDQMASRYGMDTARELLRETYMEPLAFAKNLIEEENLDCDYNTYGRFRGQWSTAQYDATARSLDDLRKLVPMNLEMVPRKRQRDEVGTDIYFGGLILHDHGGLHPGKYLRAMIGTAQKAGATICASTPVNGITPSGSGFTVETARGNIRTGAVLMATNGYTKPAFSWWKRRIFNPTITMIVTEELPPDTIETIMPGKRMVVETRSRHCYYRLSPDGKRLMIGGRAGLTRIPVEKAQSILRNLMIQIFPELHSAGISHCWQGDTGFSFSYLPNIGQHNGIWHAMGYSGSGNGMAPYLGNKVALNMLDLPGKDTSFTKTTLESKFWYRGWPWFLPIAHKFFRLQDIKEDLARR